MNQKQISNVWILRKEAHSQAFLGLKIEFFCDSYLMKKWSCFQNTVIQLGLCMLMLGISHSSSYGLQKNNV